MTDGDNTGLIAMHSLSKTANMASYRAGFFAGDNDLIAELLQLRKHAGLIVPGPIQAAMVAALNDDDTEALQRNRYASRRAVLMHALVDAGFTIDHSDAGMYLWATRGENCRETIDWLAERGILAAPGDFTAQPARSTCALASMAPMSASMPPWTASPVPNSGRPPARAGISPRKTVLRGRVPEEEYFAARAGDSPFARHRAVARRRTPASRARLVPPCGAAGAPIPFDYSVVHADRDLIVADKPHFLPTTTNGRLQRETLQTRLRVDFGEDGIVPLHRLDRLTAGLVICSRNPETRAAYQRIFLEVR